MATLTELTTPRTRQEIETSIYAGVADRGVDSTTWKPGAVVRTLIVVVALVIAALDRLVVLIVKLGFLTMAKGDWLTLKAGDTYQVARGEGTFAAGSVQLTNAGGGHFEIEPGDLVVLNSTTGAQYRNTAPFTLRAFQAVDVGVRALELGAAGNAEVGEIDAFVTTLLGVTVTNAGTLRGVDPETDPELVTRSYARLGQLSSNGPSDAYFSAATGARRADGTRIGVTRVRTIADGVGGVDVYVASPGGALDGTAGDPATDLGAVAAAVAAEAVPEGVTASVQNAVGVTVPVTYELWIREAVALEDDEIEEAIEEALSSRVGSEPIGGVRLPGEPGRFYRSGLAIALAEPFEDVADLIDLEITAPAADVDLDTDEVAVLGAVTVTAIHRS